jgi:hypothetical protein
VKSERFSSSFSQDRLLTSLKFERKYIKRTYDEHSSAVCVRAPWPNNYEHRGNPLMVVVLLIANYL